MPKGRPVKTEIREKIASILKQTNIAYGYQIYKIYKNIFGYISLRNLYYNLKKGVDLGEFLIVDIKKESGIFTWGGIVEHKYYTLGPYAIFHKLSESQNNKIKSLKRENFDLDWMKEIKTQIEKLEEKIKKFNTIKVRLKYEDKRQMEKNLKSKIEYLKSWLKEKMGNNQVLKAQINKLYDLFDTHTP